MVRWDEAWGPRPKRVVAPYWWPPGLILRQAASALYVGALAHWRGIPGWFARYGFRCLPGAAGSRGMGCIGFPPHPVWEMTTACNLHCIHCHTSAGRPSADELTTPEARRMLNELATNADFRMMAFTGGEPLLRQDLFELLAYSHALGFNNTIATNATLVDEAVARDLNRQGVVIAAVSLDGFDAASHDRIRGSRGAFDAALAGMRALRKAGILLHVNITAMEYNLDQLEPLVQLVEALGAGILLFYQLVPVGRGKGIGAASLDLSANEKLIRFMARAQEDARAIMEPVAGPQYWPFLLQRAGIRSGHRLRLAEWVFHGCSAGRGFVYIKPNGKVWPCPFIELACADAREEGFLDTLNRSAVIQDLQQREARLGGRCGRCTYRRLCGGCRGRALATTGDLLAEDPFCFLEPCASAEVTSAE